MGDPKFDDDEVIITNPTDDVVDYWATLIEAKSGSSSFDIRDATFEINLFEDSSIFTKGSKGNKREIRRRIKTILNNSSFPEEQKRKAAEYYAENPEYMHLPIDKMDPNKLFLFDVVDESFVCVNELENKGMLKPIKDVEFDWNTFKTFKELNFISRQERVLEKEIAEDLTPRISSRKPRTRPPSKNLVKKGTLKNQEDDDEFYPEREKELTSERKRRESEIERKRREREQDFELQQERLYEIYKKSQQKREQNLQIQSQFQIKEITNFGAQNSRPQHSQNRSESYYENRKKTSPNKKERERERKRDQSPESPHHHKSSKRDQSPASPQHHKSKKKHRGRSSSSERSIFSGSSSSSKEEKSVPRHQSSSKKNLQKTKTPGPPARIENEGAPRAQAIPKKPKQDEDVNLFSDDSEQSQGYSFPMTKKNRRNSSHINPSSLESIPEEAHPESDGPEIFEITEEDHEEISQLIEEKINRNKAVKKGSGKEILEIVKVQEEIIIPSGRPNQEEHEEIAELMEENISRSRMIPRIAKIEEDFLSHYKKEMEELIKETIHQELQQIGIKKYYDEPDEDLGKMIEEKINKSKAPLKPTNRIEEDFSIQYKKAMKQAIPNQRGSSSDAGRIEEEISNEDIKDLSQLIEEKINKSKRSEQSKKIDRDHQAHHEKETIRNQGPLLIHDVIEDRSLDIYDPELAQLMEEKMNLGRSSSPRLKKVIENDHEKNSVHSYYNSPQQNGVGGECNSDKNDLERTQIIEEESHSSKNSSPHNKKPSHHEKQPVHHHYYSESHHIEDGEVIQEKVRQSKDSSTHQKVSKDSSHERNQRSRSRRSRHKKSHRDHHRDNRSNSPDHSHKSHHKKSHHHHEGKKESCPERSQEITDQRNRQEAKFNHNMKVEYGKSNFTSETKASTEKNHPSQEGSIDQCDLPHQNPSKNLLNFNQDNSEVLIIEDEEEEFRSVKLVISDLKGAFNDSEVEEIDISGIQSQDLNKKSPDSKSTSPQKDIPKIITLETRRLPPKELHDDKSEKNKNNKENHHSELSNSPPASQETKPTVSNNPAQALTLTPENQPIDPFASKMGNIFGGQFIGPAPFQYYPPIFFPPLNESFETFVQRQFIPSGPGGVFAGNFMAPPPNHFMPSRNNSEKPSGNSDTDKQEKKQKTP